MGCDAADSRLFPRPAPPSLSGIPRTTLIPILIVIVANWIAFSILGGALLTRYLLPIYPLILLLALSIWRERTSLWPLLTTLTAAAFIAALHMESGTARGEDSSTSGLKDDERSTSLGGASRLASSG